MKQSLWTVLTTLLISSVSWSQSSTSEVDSTTSPNELDGKSVEQVMFEERLQNALQLSETQQIHLQDLRQILQEQLAAIRLQVETGRLDEQEARWQVKMALASHRQGRAALLEDDQIATLQNIYNERGEKGREPFSLLPLNALQQEHIRLLLWEQSQEWRTLTESDTPPTEAQQQALRQTHQVAFERLLNGRQKAALQALKDARRRHYGLEVKMLNDTPTLLDDAPDASIE